MTDMTTTISILSLFGGAMLILFGMKLAGDGLQRAVGARLRNFLLTATDTPIEGLYVCGESTYPGGLVLGGSGYIGANKVAEDLGVKKWWKPTPQMERYIKTYLE